MSVVLVGCMIYSKMIMFILTSYAFYNYIGRWYQVSEDWFENVFHWTQWWSFVPKVAVDQTLWGPFWNNSKLYFQILSLQLVVKSNIHIFAFI